MKRIAVTTENGEIYQHFGKTQCFTLYTIEDGKVADKKLLDTSDSGHSALAGVLKQAGAELLICGGIGQGARDALSEAGIQLLAGASGSVDAAVEAYLAGNLMDNPAGQCDHHHGEAHHCHH